MPPPHVNHQDLVAYAQQAAGIVAARQRGDVDGANALMASFPDAETRAVGFFVVAELSLALLAQATGETVDQVTQDLSLAIMAAFAQ